MRHLLSQQRLTRLALVCGVTAAGIGALPGTAAAAKPEALTPLQAAARATGSGHGRDALISSGPSATSPSSLARSATASKAPWTGGRYSVVVGGKTVKVTVWLSSRFATSAAVNRSWALFIARLPHGTELAHLTLYIATLDQIQSEYCGAWADSCYWPNEGRIYLTGETPPDGANIQQIAAHEYAHHIAGFRVNYPWDTLGRGPKRWATSMHVCEQTAAGNMHPGDEVDYYYSNPGEIWAESYRAYASTFAGLIPDTWASFAPDSDLATWLGWTQTPTNLAAAAKDVSTPWAGQYKPPANAKPTFPWPGQHLQTLTAPLGASGPQVSTITIPTTLDGRLEYLTTVTGSLRVRVTATSADGKPLALSGTSTKAKAQLCGTSAAIVRVTRLSGNGKWKMTVGDPGN